MPVRIGTSLRRRSSAGPVGLREGVGSDLLVNSTEGDKSAILVCRNLSASDTTQA